MNILERKLKKASSGEDLFKPVIFNLQKLRHCQAVQRLFARHLIREVRDDYLEQQRELFAILHPALIFQLNFPQQVNSYLRGLKKRISFREQGRWVYYPWLSVLAHVLEDKDFQVVRMARNRELINTEEQKKFYEATIGIAGLSVGNSVALAIVLQGGGRHIRLADHDHLALSNLNRIRSGVESLGLPKTVITARQIYTLNPYAQVEIFSEGLTEKNIGKFFSGPPALEIVIDEIDNLALKFLIREQARQRRLAVVMAADNGDNGVLDVERYDLHPATPFFHGRMGEVSYEQLKKLDKMGIGRMITKHVGPENISERMQQSLLGIGKTIVSWPQLGGAALLNGSAVAYSVRKILAGQSLVDNRALISLDEKLIPDYFSAKEKKKRQRIAQKFKELFNLE